MKKEGTVVRWDATRGFGFIRSPATDADIFFHARDMKSADAPQAGLAVTFEEIHVGGKGPRAVAVQLAASGPVASSRRAAPRPAFHAQSPSRNRPAPQRPHRTPAPSTTPAPTGAVLLMMMAWAALIAWGVWAGDLPVLTLAFALLLNLATFFVYWRDKYAAQQGQWRTPENTLHLLGLLGGWPGAWWAQQILRHKSRKASFRAAYWATVGLHCSALAGWTFRQPLQNLL